MSDFIDSEAEESEVGFLLIFPLTLHLLLNTWLTYLFVFQDEELEKKKTKRKAIDSDDDDEDGKFFLSFICLFHMVYKCHEPMITITAQI